MWEEKKLLYYQTQSHLLWNNRSGIFVQQDDKLFLYNNQEYPLKYVKVSHLTAPEVLQLLLQSIFRFILRLTTSWLG